MSSRAKSRTSPLPTTSRATGAVGTPASPSSAAYAAIWSSAGTLSVRASLVSLTSQPSAVRSRKSAWPTNPPSKKVAW